MKTLKGDLIKLALDGEFDVIVHGCNCFCTMGAGIAKQIKHTFPMAYAIDLQTNKGDKAKLGTINYVKTKGVTVVNAYTQYGYGRGQIHTDYTAIQTAFKQIAKTFFNSRIGYPAIGAGHAGGNWDIISTIINKELLNLNHTFVSLK